MRVLRYLPRFEVMDAARFDFRRQRVFDLQAIERPKRPGI